MKIIIIGAGMGGLSAGIYGQMNGYDTEIYEMHSKAGGQCASWSRNGYTFDACIHHLVGCKDGSRVNQIWKNLGAMPLNLVYTRELVAAAFPGKEMFYDYYDLDKLRNHMLQIAPEDAPEIEKYISGIRSFLNKDVMGRMAAGKKDMLGMMPLVIKNMKYFKMSLKDYALRFKNPLLRRAIPMLEYSIPEIPTAVHFSKHAAGTDGDIAWPVGASQTLSEAMEKRYSDLGGKLHFGKKVEKILTQGNRVVGIRLADGSDQFSDIVISNADGRKTISGLLGGEYSNSDIDKWMQIDDKPGNWAAMVYLGVNRNLKDEPSALVLLLEKPVKLTGQEVDSLELQLYGFDTTMAPAGKGVIKAEITGTYSYWNDCTPEEYADKKREITDQVIDILESHYPGIREQVEVTDVVTLKTWERFMGGTHGFNNGPNKPFGFKSILSGKKTTLPGLERFYMAGTWVSGMGAAFINAQTGKTVIQQICKKDKKRFQSEPRLDFQSRE